MPRRVTKRTDYMQEAIAMRRYAGAVALDSEATEEWKRDTIAHLQAAMSLFLERDSKRMRSDSNGE